MVYQVRTIAGKGRGKRIGFPTINAAIPDPFDVSHGIYAGFVYVGDRRYDAAIHYGPIPTFGERADSLEMYVLDGVIPSLPAEVGVECIAYVREIKLFLNAQELAQQIAVDVEDVRRILKAYTTR